MADGKWIEGLSAETPVVEAARIVLTVRFGIVRDAIRPAVERPNEDNEHIHRLRVGTRRAGAALKLLGDCLPKKMKNIAKVSLRLLRHAAGGARDWDVFLEGLADSKPLQTEAGKPALDFLLGYALCERAAAQKGLVTTASHAAQNFEDVCDELSGAVEKPDGKAPSTLGRLAEHDLHELFEQFHTTVDSNPTEATDLHQLRIRGKKLRYAMELFAGCFEPSFKEVLYPEVEKLQELLGALQDAHVGVGRLDDLRNRVKQVMPAEWGRLGPGLDRQKAMLRRRLVSGQKQFQTWSAAWKKLRDEYQLDELKAVEKASVSK